MEKDIDATPAVNLASDHGRGRSEDAIGATTSPMYDMTRNADPPPLLPGQAHEVLLHTCQNVALPLVLVSPDAAAAEARAGTILAAVGLDDRGDGYARDLSEGELQRAR